MIDFTIRILRERTGDGVSAEFRVDFGAKRPTEPELKALSAYFCPQLEKLARKHLDMPSGWHVASPTKQP